MGDLIPARCPSHPSLWVPHLGVRFADGVALVTADQAAALAPYAIHGVQIGDDPEPEPEASPAPEGEDEPEPEAQSVAKPKATTRRRSTKPFG